MNDALCDLVRARLDALGLNPFEAARRGGLERSYLNDILIGKKNSIRDDKKAQVAAALGVPISDLWDQSQSARGIAVMGRVGAGAEIEPEFEQVPPEGLFEVEVNMPLPPGMIGFEVVGDSMFPRYDDGDVIICHADGEPAAIAEGDEAAVRTSDGRRFLKKVTRNGKGFDLESHNAPTIRNVGLEWASPVVMIVRRSRWKRLGNGNGKPKAGAKGRK